MFLELAAAGYSPKNEKSTVYNCIAYAAGDESRKWQGSNKGRRSVRATMMT